MNVKKQQHEYTKKTVGLLSICILNLQKKTMWFKVIINDASSYKPIVKPK